MAFPSSPTNGQLATVNGIIYRYGSSTRSWTRIVGSANVITTNNITVTANATVGNVLASSYYFANGTPFSSGSPAGGSDTQVQFNDGGTTFGGNANLTFNKSTSVLLLRNNNVITNFTGNSAPTNPKQGDEWYYRPTDTLYKYIYDGATYNWISISSALYAANTGAVANTLALRDSGGNLTATNFLGIASSAKYADLAENYVADKVYLPSVVVIFGGEKEITISTQSHDTRVAGVISTNPAYLMNSECDGLPVAFTGRVPCLVKGPVNKGDLLVTSTEPGVAQALVSAEFKPGCVFGKSLEQITDSNITTIEVVVGRF